MIKKVFLKSIITLNYLVAILLISSALSYRIDPSRFWFAGAFGLLFPILLLMNITFLFYWAYKRKGNLLISFVAILLVYKSILSFCQINFKSTTPYPHNNSTKLKIMTYNVRLFNRYKWTKEKNTVGDMLNFIKEEDPDIICFQEYYANEKGEISSKYIEQFLDSYPYHHKHFLLNAYIRKYGIVTYSKHPIVRKSKVVLSKTMNSCIYSDIKIGKDTLRIYNAHLQSFRFGTKAYNFFDSLGIESEKMKILKAISKDFKSAYFKRSQQAKVIKNNINRSKYPVILCGDFNDPPFSYTYHIISKGMKDAFIEKGSGFSNTYNGKLPSFRIDYFLYSKDKLLTIDLYKRYKVPYSDHFPVCASFYINKKSPSKTGA